MPTRPDQPAPRGARGPVNWGRVFPTRPGNIPSKLLGPIIAELLEQQQLTRTQAAQLTGVPERRIWGLLNADCLSVGFDTADQLLTGLDAAHLWHCEPLEHYFLPPDGPLINPTYVPRRRAS